MANGNGQLNRSPANKSSQPACIIQKAKENIHQTILLLSLTASVEY
jgi:hypothetical protein